MFNQTVIDLVIKARELEIVRLRRKAGRLARKSALQALSVLRRVDYLEQLNKQQRGPAKLFPYLVASQSRSLFF